MSRVKNCLYLGGFHQLPEIENLKLLTFEAKEVRGIPVIPDAGNVVRRLLFLIKSIFSKKERIELIVTYSFGAAYFRGKWRCLVKHWYERLLMECLMLAAKRHQAKLVVIDQTDDLTIHPVNHRLLSQCHFYFKRELAQDGWRSLESLHGGATRPPTIGFRMLERNQKLVRKLRPISLGFGGSERQAMEWSDRLPEPTQDGKEYDLIFVGMDWCRPLRATAIAELKEALGKDLRIFVCEERMDFEDFVRKVHASWLCLSPPGLGWDCYRHYEAPAFGALPVLTWPDIQTHEGFTHGVDAIYYDGHRPIIDQIKPWLEDKENLLKMIKRARERARAYHTSQAHARHVLSLVECSGD